MTNYLTGRVVEDLELATFITLYVVPGIFLLDINNNNKFSNTKTHVQVLKL